LVLASLKLWCVASLVAGFDIPASFGLASKNYLILFEIHRLIPIRR
jgi:hypothetical protein